MKKKILVTGGAGFMGSHLADQLINEGHEVVVVDNLSGGYLENVNKKATFIKGDLQDKKVCDRAVEGVDMVYHLAAHAAEGQSIFCPVYNAKSNYIGFLQLLESSINSDVKTFIHTSSMSVYGKQLKMPMRENQPYNPKDPYAVGKQAMEQVLSIYHDVFGINYSILIPHNVYGERQNLSDPYRNAVAIFMNRVIVGKPPIIFGDGNQTRAFTYVRDCTPYIAKAGFTKSAFGERINIGTEEVTSLNELSKLVLEVMGRTDLKPIYAPERPSEVKHSYCSSKKAERILGYKTSTPLKQGLINMKKWVEKVGHRDFKYWDELEIKKKAPKVWLNKMQ
ncbi:MAG: SDR family NAD(P)-dependent oxidoreductase [Candidatus Woesearchaeota archaeon]|nr:SDR family NAD(P)-dependent oxidoreductase [Candidatus Woesearchaeota archaeon]